MNIYRTRFNSRCPENGDIINYELEIQSRETLMAEWIERAAAVESSLHEVLADALFKRFGGRQSLKARHGSVEIETIRGE